MAAPEKSVVKLEQIETLGYLEDVASENSLTSPGEFMKKHIIKSPQFVLTCVLFVIFEIIISTT